MIKIIKKMPRMKRLSQHTRILESVKSSVGRIGNSLAEDVRNNCPPDRLVIHGPHAGQSLRKSIDASPPFEDGRSVYSGLGDKRKMVPWWEAVEFGIRPSKKYRFAPIKGKGKHGEGYMVKSKKGASSAAKPQRMFAITYRMRMGEVFYKINSALKKALK